MNPEKKYNLCNNIYFFIIAIFILFSIAEIIIKKDIEDSVMNIFFIFILLSNLGRPYGIFIAILGLFSLATTPLMIKDGLLEGNPMYGILEDSLLVVMGVFGYLITLNAPILCCECNTKFYGKRVDGISLKLKIPKDKKKKKLHVCNICIGLDHWNKIIDLKEDKEDHTPFKKMNKLKDTRWFMPTILFGLAGIFILLSIIQTALMFAVFGIMRIITKAIKDKKEGSD